MKDNGQGEPAVRPEDIVAAVEVIFLKDGRVFMKYPQDNLPLTLQLLAQGVGAIAQIMKGRQEEPRRVIPISGLPAWMKKQK